MDSVTRLGLLGPLTIAGGADGSAVLRQPKRAALLIYLACRPGIPVRRDALLALFWPDNDDTHARDALNSALRFLRRQLGEATILSLPGDAVAVDPALIQTDVAQFCAALDDGRHLEALALYRGPFLEAFHTDAPGFDEWQDAERARLHGQAVGVAHLLAERAARDGLADAALATALKWAALAPGDEQAALQVMAVLHAVGDRGGAIVTWDGFVTRLDRDFGAEPSREALQEVERVRRGGAPRFSLRTEGPQPRVPDRGVAPGSPDPLAPLAPRKPRAAVLAMPAVLLLAAVVTSLVRPWSHRSEAMDLAQLTHDGQARWPMLSPDGSEVVYSRVECDASRRCVSALVVADVEGGSGRVLVRATANLAPMFWTADGRAIAVRSLTGLQGITWDPDTDWPPGAYLLPLDGGRHRRIGCCEASRGAHPDTIGLLQDGQGARIRFLTLSDGVIHDSLIFAVGTSTSRFEVSPDLRFFLLGRTIRDRRGRTLGQLPADPAGCGIGPAEWMPDGRAILYTRCHHRLEGMAVLLRQGVTADGRLQGPPDTVLATLPLSSTYPFLDIADDASQLVYLNGREHVSMALRRESTRDSLWQSRPLVSSFFRVHSLPSPDGTLALISRVVDADLQIRSLSVMPLDSGPEIQLGEFPGLQMGRVDWAPDSRALLAFQIRERDAALELLRIDAASGQRTSLAVLRPDGGAVNDVHALPGGGMVLSVRDSTMSGIRRFMVPGLPDTVFALPPIQTSAGVLAVSPDGREVAAFGQDGRQFYVEGVDLRTGARRRLVTGGVSPQLRPFWFRDGSILFPALGPWKVLTPEGELRPVGEPPFPMANFHFADNGLAGIANVVSNRGNVFIVQNFGKLLRP